MVGIIFSLMGSCAKSRMYPVFMVSLVILAIYAVAVSPFVIDGSNVVINQIYALLETKLGYIFPRYETGSVSVFNTTLFLVLPAALLGILSGIATVSKGPWVWLLTPLAAAPCVATIFGIFSVDMWALLLGGGLALLWNRHFTLGNHLPDAGRLMPAVTVQIGTIFLLFVLIAGLLVGDQTQWAKSNRMGVGLQIHQWRYEQTETTLPEGDFSELKGFTPSEEIAMQITAEEAQELYLRGYVGETYTGSGWVTLDASQYAPYAKLFSWLHERDFYGQRQYAQVSQILGSVSTYTSIDIEVLNACTAWEYAPYELMTGDTDPRKIGDQNLPSSGLRGQNEYTFMASGYSVKSWETLADKLSAAQKASNSEVITYLESENAYREFIYDSYLDVPEAAGEALSDMLRGMSLPEDRKISFKEAQMVVSAYLSNVVSYEEEPEPIAADRDFLTGFLQDTKEGYSVHYATAATLLFRYLGVPARYVEGWYIPKEAFQTAGDDALLVDQSYAHAWVEIYRDGIGFIPFEITPPYTEPMQQSGFTPQGGGGAEEPPLEEENERLTPWQIIAMVAGLFLLILLLLLVGILLRRQIIRRKRKLMFIRDDPSIAVSNMTTWAVTMLTHFGIVRRGGSLYELRGKIEQELDFDAGEQYHKLIALQQSVIFSPRGATEQDRELPQRFLGELEQALFKRSRFMGRLKLKYIACVL